MQQQLRATDADRSSRLGKPGLGAISIIEGRKVPLMEDVTNAEARIRWVQMLGSDAFVSKNLTLNLTCSLKKGEIAREGSRSGDREGG